MGAIERRFAMAGLELAALEWPGEGLPILALHGWLDNAASFVPLAEYLAPCHLLALELPGHGHSDHLPEAARYHLADNLYWVQAVADEMGWSRFYLLGHSMGAAIATLTAAAMPQRVIGLSLLDGLGPIAYTPEVEARRLRELFAGEMKAKAVRPFRDIATAARVLQRYGRFPIALEAATRIVERNLQRREDGYYWRYDPRLSMPSNHYYCEEQVQGILQTIRVPTLLITAEQGATCGWQGFETRRAALPGLRHLVLPGGHHLHMEQPQAVGARLLDFYREFDGEAR